MQLLRIPNTREVKEGGQSASPATTIPDESAEMQTDCRKCLYKYSYSESAIGIDGYVISGSVRTVKLKMAQSANSPLAFYDATTRQFYVRLGAELPGLFGRSMVAASGLAPREDLTQRVVVYSGIEPQLARLIYGQLMS